MQAACYKGGKLGRFEVVGVFLLSFHTGDLAGNPTAQGGPTGKSQKATGDQPDRASQSTRQVVSADDSGLEPPPRQASGGRLESFADRQEFVENRPQFGVVVAVRRCHHSNLG